MISAIRRVSVEKRVRAVGYVDLVSSSQAVSSTTSRPSVVAPLSATTDARSAFDITAIGTILIVLSS